MNQVTSEKIKIQFELLEAEYLEGFLCAIMDIDFLCCILHSGDSEITANDLQEGAGRRLISVMRCALNYGLIHLQQRMFRPTDERCTTVCKRAVAALFYPYFL